MMSATRIPSLPLLALGVVFATIACRKIDNIHETATTTATGKMPTGSGASNGDASTGNHDPMHPPIDCPLHKMGVDPAHVRPFDEVEKYIAFLEKPERATWQKPDAVVAALGLQGTETLVDIGAGSGYFTFRFSHALPKGKVIAEDTEPEMVRYVHHRVMTEGITNIEAVLINPDRPEVSREADWIFVCDVLHHVADQPKWLSQITTGMKTGARFALIEFRAGKLPEGPPESVKIPRTKLDSLFVSAGLVFDHEQRDLLPYQLFLVYRKP